MSTSRDPPTIAIGFWGIMRSTTRTHKNIHEKIISPLKKMGFNVRIYLHTYKVDGIYQNRWAREGSTTIDEQTYTLLTPDVHCIDNQVAFDSTFNVRNYATHGDPWKNNYCSLQNLVRYLNSQKQLIHLIESDINTNGYEFDAIFLVRPDANYVYEISHDIVQKAIALKDNELLIPDFNHWGGVNDRMAVGKWPAILTYGTRGSEALAYSKKKPLHSETFLKDYLTQHKIEWRPIIYPFQLVRTNGRVVYT
jgi:hypothetical protein